MSLMGGWRLGEDSVSIEKGEESKAKSEVKARATHRHSQKRHVCP